MIRTDTLRRIVSHGSAWCQLKSDFTLGSPFAVFLFLAGETRSSAAGVGPAGPKSRDPKGARCVREDIVIADVDCTVDGGKELCEEMGVQGYPSIKYGDPNNMEDYEGAPTYLSFPPSLCRWIGR